MLKLELAALNEPEILFDIWAELDSVPVGKLDSTWLADIKPWLCHEPEIPAGVKSLSPPASNDVNLVLIDELGDVNDPEISPAIWAELDKIPDFNPDPPSKDETLVLNEELGSAKAPEIPAAVNEVPASKVVTLVLNEPLSVLN